MSAQPDLLIHELAHVWQYEQGLIEPVTAGLTGLTAEGIERVTGTDDLLYHYTLDDFKNSDRRHISEYHFEHQAAILQDAYLYFHTTDDLLYNQEFVKRSDYWDKYYERLLEEFQEWHKQLQLGSDSYMTHN